MLGPILRRLEDLAPVASVVAAYLRPFITRKTVVTSLTSFLADAERSQSSFLSTWLFAAMLEHPGSLPIGWVEQAKRRLQDRNQPAFLRVVAAVVVARGRRASDIAWIKSDIDREHDPVALRGYVVGLHWVRELDKGTQRRLGARSPQLAATVSFLQGRVVLPSLVYSNTKLKLD
jgi:hypothetical protein